jgi:putative zinc finger/helix-turn-helix YgiT family protein
MALATLPYEIQIDHDGRKYQVRLPDFRVPRCQNCGAISIDAAAGDQIESAFRKQAGLLAPRQIRDYRKKLQLGQQQLADRLGVALETVSRWETGAQVQQRSLDRFMRLFFGLAQVRRVLSDESRLESLGLKKRAV